ncbi:MAG: tetraacyldisaccharide 4'-kinase, partial [Rhodocyclaceae bacterium]
MALSAFLARSVQHRGWPARSLLPLSWLFGALAAGRRLLFRRRILKQSAVGVPVIVVGNITAGGSGKTPLVLWLADALRQRGFRPGIISRGYGGTASAPQAVAAD